MKVKVICKEFKDITIDDLISVFNAVLNEPMRSDIVRYSQSEAMWLSERLPQFVEAFPDGLVIYGKNATIFDYYTLT